MKKLLALCLLAACELQPAPKQAPPAASSPPAGSAAPVAVAPTAGSAEAVVAPSAGSGAPAAAGSAAPVAVGSGAGSGARVIPVQPTVQVTAECEKAAVRYTELFIAAAPESQRGIYEQDRANTVRRTEVACTQQAWTAPALACIGQAKNDRDARACLDKFPPPGARPPGKAYHPPRD